MGPIDTKGALPLTSPFLQGPSQLKGGSLGQRGVELTASNPKGSSKAWWKPSTWVSLLSRAVSHLKEQNQLGSERKLLKRVGDKTSDVQSKIGELRGQAKGQMGHVVKAKGQLKVAKDVLSSIQQQKSELLEQRDSLRTRFTQRSQKARQVRQLESQLSVAKNAFSSALSELHSHREIGPERELAQKGFDVARSNLEKAVRALNTAKRELKAMPSVMQLHGEVTALTSKLQKLEVKEKHAQGIMQSIQKRIDMHTTAAKTLLVQAKKLGRSVDRLKFQVMDLSIKHQMLDLIKQYGNGTSDQAREITRLARQQLDMLQQTR